MFYLNSVSLFFQTNLTSYDNIVIFGVEQMVSASASALNTKFYDHACV